MRRVLTTMTTLAVLAGVTGVAQAEWRFGAGFMGGSIASSRLYRASAFDRADWNWEQPAGDARIQGSEVLVETSGLFDADFASSLQLGLRVSMVSEESRWGGVFTLAFADLDVVAKRRTTRDNVDEVIWDQFFTTQIHAVGTYSLALDEKTPYLLGGIGWVQRGSEGESLDQGSPAVVVGAGMRFWNGGRSLIDLELRGVWSPLDLDDEDARLSTDIEAQNERDRPGLPSEYDFDGESAALAIEINASWSYVF